MKRRLLMWLLGRDVVTACQQPIDEPLKVHISNGGSRVRVCMTSLLTNSKITKQMQQWSQQRGVR